MVAGCSFEPLSFKEFQTGVPFELYGSHAHAIVHPDDGRGFPVLTVLFIVCPIIGFIIFISLAYLADVLLAKHKWVRRLVMIPLLLIAGFCFMFLFVVVATLGAF